jgi:hypothetical protein
MKESAADAKVFRAPWWIACVLGIGASACIAFGLYAHFAGLSLWWQLFYALAAPAAVAALVESLLLRVELRRNALVIRGALRRREFQKSSLTEVSWAKGCPVAVKSRDGEWMRLPEVSVGSQSMANSVRAWLRQG